MQSEIPGGWKRENLAEFTYIKGKSDTRYYPGDYAYLAPEYLRNGTEPFFIQKFHGAVETSDSETILLWDGSNAGEVFRAKKGLLASTMVKFVVKNYIDRDFFFYSLKFHEDKLKSETHGTGIPHVEKATLSKLDYIYPKSLKEQQEIASILQTIDNTIEKTKELIEKHKMMKQGTMRDLFANFEHDTESTLSDCCIFIRDGTHASLQDFEQGIPLLSAKDVAEGVIYIDSNPRRISLKDYNIIHAKYEIAEGDIVLTIVGTIGRSAVVGKIKKKFTFQRSVAILRPKKEIHSRFLYHYMNTSQFLKQLEMAINASAQGGVYLGTLNKMEICVPKQKIQSHISNILDSIDNRIESEQSYLNKLIKMKVGLMQDLLIGKVRVAM